MVLLFCSHLSHLHSTLLHLPHFLSFCSEFASCCLYSLCSLMPAIPNPSTFFQLTLYRQTPLACSLSIMKGTMEGASFVSCPVLEFSAWHQQRDHSWGSPWNQGRPLTRASLVSTSLRWNIHKMECAYSSNMQRSWSILCRNKIRGLLILKSVCCACVSVNLLIGSLQVADVV